MKKAGQISERGFTLIEMLTVIGIIGILSALSLNSFAVYRASAAYAAVQTSITQARVAVEASMSEPDATYSDVNYQQIVQGRMIDVNASALLPQFQVSRNTKVSVFYDSACDTALCMSTEVTVRHKHGKKYAFWTRMGDGLDILTEDAPGAGY